MVSVNLYSENSKELEKFLEDNTNIVSIVRFDPALTRAVNYALGEQIIDIQANGKLKLNEKGKKLYEEIMNDNSIMIMEKDSLKNISNKLTEEKINEIIVSWRNCNVLDKSIKNSN